MSWLFVHALDVWLFRDGRPFDPASDRRAVSLFPPYPTVVQGAIRSKYLTSQGVSLNTEPAVRKQEIRDLVGEPLQFSDQELLDLGGLLIRGPFLAQLGTSLQPEVYYPQPADAYSTDKDNHRIRPASKPEPIPDRIITGSDPEHFLLGFLDQPVKGERGLWLDQAAILDYLNGKEVTGIQSQQLFEREIRTGIGMQSQKRVVEEGLIYEVEFVRPMHKVGLLIHVTGYSNFPEQGILSLGGESRPANFQQVTFDSTLNIPSPLPRKFKVYFATPAYFHNGYQPSDWAEFFVDGKVTLRAAALNRYESLGGFDYARQDHKPALRFVPAGSVYYFETDGKTKLNPDLIQSAITEFGAQIGFGQIIIPEKEW